MGKETLCSCKRNGEKKKDVDKRRKNFYNKKKAVKGITGAEPTERENRPRLKGGSCLGGGGLPGAPS